MSILSIQLFPLQQPLYPHCTLPLHIFEQRYRTMIKMCVEHNVPFGVVQITTGVEVGGRATTYPIGTLAKIKHVTEFADGRMFITTEGTQRFQILQSGYDGECMTGRVELFEDEPFEQASLRSLTDNLSRDFQKYWQLLATVMNRDLGRVELPSEPDVVSWLIPSVLHVPSEIKQAILQKRNVHERLEIEQELLEEEFEKLRDMMREARFE
ncbi:MAG: LON peptidase substrate-binding domain-containing protein [Tumebacillaceae bacterium]